MLVKNLKSCAEFTAGDGTRLRELLHPARDAVTCRCSVARARLRVGQCSQLHALASTEIYYILAGKGRMEIDEETRIVKTGDTVVIPPHGRQRIESLGPDELQFLCIVDPPWRPEDEQILE